MTRNALLLGLLSFGLLVAALATRNGALALMALPFLACFAAGVWAAPVREGLHLQAERSLRLAPDGDATVVGVDLTVRNASAGPLWLQIDDPTPDGVELASGSARRRAALAPGEETALHYAFRAERGSFSWRTATVTASDPLGLFEQRLALPAAAACPVPPPRPPIRAITLRPPRRPFHSIPLRPETTLHTLGCIPSRLGGTGTDFRGVRDYYPGDPLRRLDWRLAARHPGRFFTKEFELEEAADIGLILDARPEADMRVGRQSLFEHSVGAAASLAETFLRQGHRVSLLVFGGRLKMVYPGYSKAQLNRILGALAQARADPAAAGRGLTYLPLQSFSTRALLVVLSALTADAEPFFRRLRAHGNQGLLICPDAIDFALGAHPAEWGCSPGVRLARVERRLQLRAIGQLGIRVIDWRVGQPLSPLVYEAFRPVRGAGGRLR
jgi:uncharacterized protein (DUF58 family)